MHTTLAENLKKLKFPSKRKLTTPIKGPEIRRKEKPMDKATMKKSIRTRLQWWNSLNYTEQKRYLEEHPKSKLPIRKSVGPVDLKDKNDKKAAKNSKKDKERQGDQPDKDKKIKRKIRPKPITKNTKTTKLFKVNDAEVNSVPHAEQQKINAEIEHTITGSDDVEMHEAEENNEPDADEEEQEYIKQHKESKKDKHKAKEEAVKPPDENEESQEEDEGGDPELEDKIDKQLHPEQKLGFIKAAKIAISNKASKEDKEKALKKLNHLHALVTLTKIAGAATSVALVYYFGTTAGAQCATFFALHHAQHDLNGSATHNFLKRWAHKRVTGEEKTDDEFNKLLGIYNHSKNSSNKHHSSGGGHHKKH